LNKVSQKQVAEWAESQVTIELFKEIERSLNELIAMPARECLHYGEPIKTHEALMGQDYKAFLYMIFMQALKGDWSYFEEIEDDSYEIEDEVDE